MAGVLNKTARQYNLKCMSENGHRVTVRIAPGFNAVDDDHWSHFFRGEGKKRKTDPYLQSLVDENKIYFGEEYDEMELERDPDTKSKSKATPPPTKAKKDK